MEVAVGIRRQLQQLLLLHRALEVDRHMHRADALCYEGHVHVQPRGHAVRPKQRAKPLLVGVLVRAAAAEAALRQFEHPRFLGLLLQKVFDVDRVGRVRERQLLARRRHGRQVDRVGAAGRGSIRCRVGDDGVVAPCGRLARLGQHAAPRLALARRRIKVHEDRREQRARLPACCVVQGSERRGGAADGDGEHVLTLQGSRRDQLE